jgi:rod shape-determining protein MreC
MPLGTLDRSPPPFFRQGPSALSKLVFFGVLAVLLMVADNRFRLIQPVRAAIATVLYPLQWSMLQPVILARDGGKYFESLNTLQAHEAAAQFRLGLQSQRAQQVEELTIENALLRALLDLRARVNAPALAAQVLYAAADPFTRKVIVDKGSLAAVQPGSPVLDELGVLGQVTRVYPLVSEVTLITDRNQAIPVLNTRTGLRALAFGEPSAGAGSLELRFLDTNVDLQAGDLMTTSGIDGVYPPGLQVARVSTIERGADSAFARVRCEPVADVTGGLHVLILQPLAGQVPARPEPVVDVPVTKTKKAKP